MAMPPPQTCAQQFRRAFSPFSYPILFLPMTTPTPPLQHMHTARDSLLLLRVLYASYVNRRTGSWLGYATTSLCFYMAKSCAACCVVRGIGWAMTRLEDTWPGGNACSTSTIIIFCGPPCSRYNGNLQLTKTVGTIPANSSGIPVLLLALTLSRALSPFGIHSENGCSRVHAQFAAARLACRCLGIH